MAYTSCWKANLGGSEQKKMVIRAGGLEALSDTWPCGGCKCVEHPSEN